MTHKNANAPTVIRAQRVPFLRRGKLVYSGVIHFSRSTIRPGSHWTVKSHGKGYLIVPNSR